MYSHIIVQYWGRLG